jgi:hypothetical protein
MKGESGRSVGPAAEVAQKLRDVVVVLRLRLEPDDNPVEQFGIGAIELSFDPVGLSLAYARSQLLVVLAKLGKHVERRDEVGVVILDSLQGADVTDGAEGRAADLADALGDGVGCGKDLIGLLVQQQIVVAEMRPGDMPVEILRL